LAGWIATLLRRGSLVQKPLGPETPVDGQLPIMSWFVGGLLVVMVVTPPALFVLISQRYQLVAIEDSDPLLVVAIAVAIEIVAGRVREATFAKSRNTPRRPLSQRVGEFFLWVFVVADFLLFINGALDRGRPARLVGVLSSKACARGCSWVVIGRVGARREPTTLTVDVANVDRQRGQVGDSVLVQIKPGFLRHPWIASYAVLRRLGS
jgi:hypothetical protein